jgi:hypothetical protein
MNLHLCTHKEERQCGGPASGALEVPARRQIESLGQKKSSPMCLSVVCNAYTIVMGMQPGAPPHYREGSVPPPLAGDKMAIFAAIGL